MIPEDAIERLLDGCRDISKECELQNISYIDIVNNDNEGYYMSIDGVFKQIINGDS